MYEVRFESDRNQSYVFGPSGNTWFGMDMGNGMDVDIGLSQGFAQIGETVDTMTISGRTISVTGQLYGNIPQLKDRLRRVCAPLVSGRLIFNKTHFLRVYVKSAPTFSPVRENGLFKMQFFAPYPFFRSVDEKSFAIGVVVPQFRFPVNYGVPHRFGTTQKNRYVNVINEGDVPVPFTLRLESTGTCTDITVTNLRTFGVLKLNGDLNAGEVIDLYRDADNVLRAELTDANGAVTDVLSRIDESSTLFELAVGDNLLAADDAQGGVSLIARFSYYPAVAALYET